jgi:hypothetical protein
MISWYRCNFWIIKVSLENGVLSSSAWVGGVLRKSRLVTRSAVGPESTQNMYTNLPSTPCLEEVSVATILVQRNKSKSSSKSMNKDQCENAVVAELVDRAWIFSWLSLILVSLQSQPCLKQGVLVSLLSLASCGTLPISWFTVIEVQDPFSRSVTYWYRLTQKQ